MHDMGIKVGMTVAIPVFNEEQMLETVVQDCIKAVKNLTDDFEILIIDDGSTDNTPEIINSLAGRFKEIRYINHTRNLGFAISQKDCLTKASKDWIFLIPGDGQFNPKDIEKLWIRKEKFDLIVGYRLIRIDSLRRILATNIFHAFARFLFGIKLKEFSSVFLCNKRVINTIEFQSTKSIIVVELIVKALLNNFEIGEVGILWYPRLWGKEKGGKISSIAPVLSEMFRLYKWLKYNYKNNI